MAIVPIQVLAKTIVFVAVPDATTVEAIVRPTAIADAVAPIVFGATIDVPAAEFFGGDGIEFRALDGAEATALIAQGHPHREGEVFG